MKKEDYFPKVSIVGKKLVFNPEAIETMDLDTPGAKVILIETSNPDKPETSKNSKEILIMKTNGSLCDDLENIKDVFPPEHIRDVKIISQDDEIISGEVELTSESIDSIKTTLGDESEFKLLVCNTESALGKEFKEQFEINNNYYRFVYAKDKRVSIGKEKTANKNVEERVSIN